MNKFQAVGKNWTFSQNGITSSSIGCWHSENELIETDDSEELSVLKEILQNQDVDGALHYIAEYYKEIQERSSYSLDSLFDLAESRGLNLVKGDKPLPFTKAPEGAVYTGVCSCPDGGSVIEGRVEPYAKTHTSIVEAVEDVIKWHIDGPNGPVRSAYLLRDGEHVGVRAAIKAAGHRPLYTETYNGRVKLVSCEPI
jgi:hypothetical protein